MAEFYRLALLCGAASHIEVNLWADAIILQSTEPPSWASDISVETEPAELIDLLQTVEGEAVQLLPGRMLLGRLHRLRVCPLLAAEIARHLYSLSREGVFSTNVQDAICRIDIEFALAEKSVWSTAGAERELVDLLLAHAEYEPFKPSA